MRFFLRRGPWGILFVWFFFSNNSVGPLWCLDKNTPDHPPLLLGKYYAGSQNNIQLASDSKSEFAIDRVKLIGVSTNNSSQLNDTRDQAAEGQQQGAEESIPKSNSSRQRDGRESSVKSTCYGLIWK